MAPRKRNRWFVGKIRRTFFEFRHIPETVSDYLVRSNDDQHDCTRMTMPKRATKAEMIEIFRQSRKILALCTGNVVPFRRVA